MTTPLPSQLLQASVVYGSNPPIEVPISPAASPSEEKAETKEPEATEQP